MKTCTFQKSGLVAEIEFCDNDFVIINNIDKKGWVMLKSKTAGQPASLYRPVYGPKGAVTFWVSKDIDNAAAKWETDFVLFDGINSKAYTAEDKEAWFYVRMDQVIRSVMSLEGKNFKGWSARPPYYRHVVGYGSNWIEMAVKKQKALGATGKRGATRKWEGPYGDEMASYCGVDFSL